MNTDNCVNLTTAATLAEMSPSLFIYYLKKKGTNKPPFEIIAGIKVFDPEKVTAWAKNRHLFARLDKNAPKTQ